MSHHSQLSGFFFIWNIKGFLDRLIFTLKYERCSDGVTLTGDGVTQAELPLVDGEQV